MAVYNTIPTLIERRVFINNALVTKKGVFEKGKKKFFAVPTKAFADVPTIFSANYTLSNVYDIILTIFGNVNLDGSVTVIYPTDVKSIIENSKNSTIKEFAMKYDDSIKEISISVSLDGTPLSGLTSQSITL